MYESLTRVNMKFHQHVIVSHAGEDGGAWDSIETLCGGKCKREVEF